MKADETPIDSARRLADIDDMFVESVSEQGEVVMRYPGGWQRRFTIPEEMVPYYRRLVPRQPPRSGVVIADVARSEEGRQTV